MTASGTTAHIKNYYDNYSFVSSTDFPVNQFPNDTSGYGKGSLTGSEITVLGDSKKIYVAHYYDAKGRVVKTVRSNLPGGYDVTATTYTFTDNPATVTHTHTASGKTTRTEVYAYSYDHADRLSKVEHTLGGTKVTLAAYAYDNFGRLQSKQYHGSASNKLTYAYNLRSWLTGISGTKFTQNLYYNTGSGTAKYNGGISSMTWKAGDESTVRGYKFTYDGLDRMLNATYGETASINTNANRFSENVTGYDKNGNIQSLQRYGQTGASAYGLVDNLTFTLSGNQLSRVDDAVTAAAYNGGFEFKDAVKQASEYAYDANGNLTKDLNKGITGIQYNSLNLPSKVTFSDGSTITYIYAADGTKLRTVHTIGGTTTTTDYCGNVVYENGVQKLLLTEEGYVTLSDSKYHYYLKDHQGNNRVVINQSGTVEETNHYYPFGGMFASSASAQPYRYNGKELDAKKGLNWYDYGARHYDAAVGRFTTVDPLAEKYYPMSPYGYCGNDPINRIDPDGMDWYRFKDKNQDEWIYEWSSTIHSQEELNKTMNTAEYIGKTYVENNIYYSLFGKQLDASSFEGQIYQKIDQGIISNENYKKKESAYNGGEDISKPQIDFSINGMTIKDSKYWGIDSNRNNYKINYEGSIDGVYRVVDGKNMMKASMRDWIVDSDMPKHIGEWKSGPKLYHIRFMNKGGYDVLHLKFDAKNANIMLEKYRNLFSK